MNEKQCAILDAAFKVFARFGLRKTSIDDIAKAAEMSRQGIYLHFKNKDEIFQATLEKYLSDRSREAHAALLSKEPLDIRLSLVTKEWFARSIGFIHPDASDLLESATLFRPRYDALAKDLKLEMAKLIEKEAKLPRKVAGEIVETLMAAGMSWKHELKSEEEFAAHMKPAIDLLLSGGKAKSTSAHR